MSEIEKLPAVATKTFVFCKKCDSDRYHVVLTHTGTSSAKLECEVCKSKKTLKLKAGKTSTSTRKTTSGTRTRRSRGPSSEEVWRELRQKVGSDSAQPYSMRNSFAVDTAIDHPKFGLGIVTGATPTQIEVVFEDGPRALVHNRT